MTNVAIFTASMHLWAAVMFVMNKEDASYEYKTLVVNPSSRSVYFLP